MNKDPIQFNEGHRLSNQQIMDEYNQMYRPQITPFTNPELFDPLNPPPGYGYDAWHAIWYRHPTRSEVNMDTMVVWTAFVISIVISCWVAFK
jgi:hypothetical protein